MSEDRAEHLAWAKQRAIELVDAGELANAFASMNSDLMKHQDTAPSRESLRDGIQAVVDQDAAGVRRWIEGFT